MNEYALVKLMLGQEKSSILMTDGYKFAMAQSGFPLREETFYLSFRTPGKYYIPFDYKKVIQLLIDIEISSSDFTYLKIYNYEMTPAMKEAILSKDIKIYATPQFSWVREREPIITVTGPSFLVSWLEPMMIWINFQIQAATEMMRSRNLFYPCCPNEKEILLLIGDETKNKIYFDDFNYYKVILQSARKLVKACYGDFIIEVGMRACSCMEQHKIALTACKEAGIYFTSNVFLAASLGLKPGGTTGHEHQQRWFNDKDAYRAMRDMRAISPSYLPDTYDIKHGLADAFDIINENNKPALIRFDSSAVDFSQQQQFEYCMEREKNGNKAKGYMFQDGINPEKVKQIKKFTKELGERRMFGSGQYLVNPQVQMPTRDKVAAVYKLTRSGIKDVMKICKGTESKQSIPGKPMIVRKVNKNVSSEYIDVADIIIQEGEKIPKGFHLLEPECKQSFIDGSVIVSKETQKIISSLKQEKVI